jgi:integrase
VCASNPAAEVPRERERATDIDIFTPAETRKLLNSIKDELKPFAALWCFTGLRKEEISRLDWTEIDAALATGSVYLPASKAKTGRARSVPLGDAAKSWLIAFRKPDGPVLPARYAAQRALDRVPPLMARRAGITWKVNAPRHSFASYLLATGTPSREVASQMGSSLQQLDRHYNSRSLTITRATAQEYFDIRPGDAEAQPVPLAA